MQGARTLVRLALAASLAVLGGCATKPVPLYMWESFPKQQYDVLMHAGASPEEQIHAMELHANKARSQNASLPPGFRAHLGMLHLNVGNAQRAKELFESEKSAFPESAPYMDRLLAKLSVTVKPSQPNKTERPA